MKAIPSATKQQGIAVIVVVAVMVALIMVTTALLSTVTRATEISKVLFYRDLCRLAAVSGRADAIKKIQDIQTAVSGGTKTQLSTDINDTTFTTTTQFALATFGTQGAYGLLPYAKTAIVGRRYGIECPLRAPISWMNSGKVTDSTKIDLNAAGTTVTDTTSFSDSDTAVEDWYQTPGRYPKYKCLIGYDKDFTPTGYEVPATFAMTGSPFYSVCYALTIQDLGGCLNMNNGTTHNQYKLASSPNPAITELNIAKTIINSISTYTSPNINDLYANTAGQIVSCFNSDLELGLQFYDGRYLCQTLLMTPWGKEDPTNNIPLCVNVYTAAPKLLLGMVKNASLNGKFHIKHTPPAPASPVDIDVAAQLDSDVAGKKAYVHLYETILASRNAKKNTDDIVSDIEAIASFSAEQQKAAAVVALCLFGKFNKDLDDNAGTNTTADKGIIVCNDDSTDANRFSQFGRLVGAGSPDVDNSVIGPGPYYRVLIQGSVLNMAKSEIVQTQNLEVVYDAVNSTIVYQRWYENE